MRFRQSCSTTSTPLTGPRTAIVWWCSAIFFAPLVRACPSWCWSPTAPDPPSRSNSVRSVPNGWAAWRPPAGDEIVFRGHPTVDDPAVAIYAVAADGGTTRILSEPVGPPETDPAIDRPAISPDGQSVTFWNWDTVERSGWGHVLDLEAGTERTASTWGGSVSPFSPDGRMGCGGRQVVSCSSPLTAAGSDRRSAWTST